MTRFAVAVAVLLSFPAAAHAGTVTKSGTTIVYAASANGDSVSLGNDVGRPFVETTLAPVTIGGPGDCSAQSTTVVRCNTGTAFQVNLVAGSSENNVNGEQVTGPQPLLTQGSDANDRITGTSNGDTIAGGAGDDNLYGLAGNDTIDGGPGENHLEDGDGNDTIIGGPNSDTWIAGFGADSFTPGAGNDTVSYETRTAPVTITFNGAADDGQAGEGDNVGADAEEATGGSGNDVIVGNDLGDRLHGGAGNDHITGGKGEDRLEGGEGDDVIDARDGRYDSIDCGPGNDIVYADPGDGTENCEVAPDRDGDGYLNEADCAPDNAAIHPGAGEIYGNNVDEDCSGGPGYLRVVSPSGFATKRDGRRSRVLFTKFVVQEIKPGDTIQVTCKTKSKGCAFSTKTLTGKNKSTISILSYFKKRYLKKGAVIEVRITRANQIGAVRRLTVIKRGNFKSELLCLNPGATKPGACA